MSAKRKRCMAFKDGHIGPDGCNYVRQCAREKGHEGECRWSIGEEASWLPSAPRDVQVAFAKAVRK